VHLKVIKSIINLLKANNLLIAIVINRMYNLIV